MTKTQHDLTGRWAGVYFYPIDIEYNPMDALPPVPFDAELTDMGGVLQGSVTELDPLGPIPEATRKATLVGSHMGSDVVFTKHPDEPGDVSADFEIPHAIEYLGTLSGDGNSIAGDWHIIGDWSGTFRMQRRLAEANATISETATA